MKKFIKSKISLIISLLLACSLGASYAQGSTPEKSTPQQSTLESLMPRANVIVEGEVISIEYFIDKDSSIYTEALIKLSKIFRGNLTDSIIGVIYRGGSYGNYAQVSSHGFSLIKGEEGMLFLRDNNTIATPHGGIKSYLTTYGPKSIIKYYHDNINPPAGCLNVTYHDLEKEVFQPIEKLTGQKRRVLGPNMFERPVVKKEQK